MCETKLKMQFDDLMKKLQDIERFDLSSLLIDLYYDTRKLQYNEGRKSVLTENTENE